MARITRLTPRQRQVLQLAAGGASNPEIARGLGIAEATVKNHLHQIGARYGLGNGRVASVMEGIRRGDVDELLAYREVEARRRCADE